MKNETPRGGVPARLQRELASEFPRSTGTPAGTLAGYGLPSKVSKVFKTVVVGYRQRARERWPRAVGLHAYAVFDDQFVAHRNRGVSVD